MKKNSNSSETMQSNDGTISNAENINLVIATDSKTIAGKIFSHAELWNIQRQRKSFSQRRHSF